MKRVLITGSSGYIGQHLAQRLKGRYALGGIDVVRNITNLDIFYHSDIFDDHTTVGQVEWDAVVHLAAHVNVGESVHEPLEYYRNNIIGTGKILNDWVYNNFIFASTGTAADPISPYGLSKRAAEDVVRVHCQYEEIPYTMFRFYNVTGSNGFPPTNMDGLFYNLIKAEERGEFNLYGTDYNTLDGSAVRDYVHVEEICAAIETAIECPANGLENLGHGVGHTVKQMIDIYKRVNNVEFKVNELPRRAGDLEYSVLSNPSTYMQNLYDIEQLLVKNI